MVGLGSADGVDTAAATPTTRSFVPQALLTPRTRNVQGISVGRCGRFAAGIGPRVADGVRRGEWPITIANAVTPAVAPTILATRIPTEHARLWRRDGSRLPGAARLSGAVQDEQELPNGLPRTRVRAKPPR
jgi:MtN3 and saliva related transmembrane protein